MDNSQLTNQVSLEDSEIEIDSFLYIYDHKDKKILKNKYLMFMHKLLLIAVYNKNKNIMKLLIDSFMISPFVPSIDSISALHFACYKGYKETVKFFLGEKFVYFKSKRKFDIKSILNEPLGEESNTCLHFCCL